jgi:uncharacterized protein (TIGR02145 family)
MKNNLAILLLTTALCAVSCKKEKNPENETTGTIQLGLGLPQQQLKSTTTNETPVAIVVTIENSNASVVVESKRINLINMNGTFISEPISLTTGDYSISKYIVLNSSDSAIYATPVKGSKLAYLVKTPLPLSFTISKDNVTKIVPEVLRVEAATFEDFGYNSFSFNVVNTFDFLTSVMVYNETIKNWELTSAIITIKTADSVIVYNNTPSAITNLITLRDNSANFSLAVSKPGYTSYVANFSVSDLKLYFKSSDKGPLIITLFPESNIVTDIDGNLYHTVKIGAQIWMVENLKVTKFNDGTAIPYVTIDSAWNLLSTSGYCWYNNDIAYKNPYGGLYNWYAVNSGKLAPIGWHVPTDAEWDTLNVFLGGTTQAGGKLKESGLSHWNSPNTAATNETGFTALPNGMRAYSGKFLYQGIEAFFWSSTQYSATGALGCEMEYGNGHTFKPYSPKLSGMSVRCIKN